jgi:hypothetical protein
MLSTEDKCKTEQMEVARILVEIKTDIQKGNRNTI